MVNYDDNLYIDGSRLLSSMQYNDFLNVKYPFQGELCTPQQGTHAYIFLYIYRIFTNIPNGLLFLHFFTYLMYALAFIPVSEIVSRFTKENVNLKALIILVNPASIAYVNSFMLDIPGYVLFLWTVFLFIRYAESGEKIFVVLSFVCAFMSFSASYIFIYVSAVPLLYAYFLRRDKMKEAFVFSVLCVAVMAAQSLITTSPTMLQSLKWFGSEKLFNYHKTADKFTAFLLWMGLAAVFNIFRLKTYKDMFFYACLFFAFVGAVLLKDYPPVSVMLFILLMANGLYTVVRVLILSEKNPFLTFWANIFIFFSIIFFPMIIGRYILLIIPPVLIIITMSMSKKLLTAGAALNIVLSLLILTAEMTQTNAYSGVVKAAEGEKVYYTGEWGFRNAMENMKGKMLLKSDTSIADSALLYVPDDEQPIALSQKIVSHLHFLKRDSLYSFGMKTLSSYSKSGYYTNEFGLLPFSFSSEKSIKYSIYRYSRVRNRYLDYYSSKTALWKTYPVIAVKTSDTLKFDSAGEVEVRAVFHPYAKVAEISDGVALFLKSGSIAETLFAYPSSDNAIVRDFHGEDIEITFDSLHSSEYDWVGVYIEEKN